MAQDFSEIKKAYSLQDIHRVIGHDVPVQFGHPFYTDFSDVRGEFEDRKIYRVFNVHPKTLRYLGGDNESKPILFLAGMRGSGKTTELASIANRMHQKDCFFVVICNLDKGLDVEGLEYMDILVYQLTRLFEQLGEYKEIPFSSDILNTMQDWFAERIKEVNQAISKESRIEIALEAKTPPILSFLGFLGRLNRSVRDSKENVEKVRAAFKNNFIEFSSTLNKFFGVVNEWLDANNIAKEICFVVDGLEKIGSSTIRERFFREESNRMGQIKAKTIFTLPIELMRYCQNNRHFSEVISFPFISIRDRDGLVITKAMERFRRFIEQRIETTLFDSPDTIDRAILMSGGSPRILIRILNNAYYWVDDELGKITEQNLEKALGQLANETTKFVTQKELELLKLLKENNDKRLVTPFDNEWQKLLEAEIVLEYGDGNHKRVSPLVEISELYRQYVG